MNLSFDPLLELPGLLGASVVDSETGLILGMTDANKIDLEVASAANTEIIRAKLKTIQMLGLEDEIEDIVISLTSQYHLLRVLKENPTTFIYVALGRRQSNLALARMAMKRMEQILRL